ncbi:Uncharacterised protein [Vibrio cholerae]|nr:Uncharacterised protein [Vibrio cholerae]CSC59459.1 Uncharacterised protein [Vibrio cholerae]
MVKMFRRVFLASACACSATCIASSRVGVRIKIRAGPALRRGKSSKYCSAGITKAAVLPVPVGAEAKTSRPSSACGIASA